MILSLPPHRGPSSPPLLSTIFTPPRLLASSPPLLRRHLPARRLTISANGRRNNKNIVRFPALDRRASVHNRLRFVRKLTSLLLTKRMHFLPLRVLRRCGAYLRLTRPILPMVLRYPTIFRVIRIPTSGELAVALTPAALSLALDESSLRSRISSSLASKLQKLLLLSPSSHRRLLLSKLVHLAPDLGLPPRFRSSLVPNHPDLFRISHTSYGPALELLSFDPSLASPLTPSKPSRPPLIIDRPPRFTPVRLRKGFNLKRRHAEYLAKFAALPEPNPYADLPPPRAAYGEEIVAEKRACAVVREVLAMTVEKRTLVDHLTHFRKDFGLPNKLRAMLVRHPEMFYVSVKGKRDSVFLMEGYCRGGKLTEEDDIVALRRRLEELVSEGKKMRRERRKKGISYYEAYDDGSEEEEEEGDGGEDGEWGLVDEEGFGGDLEDLFETGVGEDWVDASELGNDGGMVVEELSSEEVAAFWRLKDHVEGVDFW